jgi:hypothetical protein
MTKYVECLREDILMKVNIRNWTGRDIKKNGVLPIVAYLVVLTVEHFYYLRFEILKSVNIKLWSSECDAVYRERYKRFGKSCCLHLLPWTWIYYVPTRLYGVTPRNTIILLYNTALFFWPFDVWCRQHSRKVGLWGMCVSPYQEWNYRPLTEMSTRNLKKEIWG